MADNETTSMGAMGAGTADPLATSTTTSPATPPQAITSGTSGPGTGRSAAPGRVSDAAPSGSETAGGAKATASQAIKDGAAKLGDQASEKARSYAEQGKTKASSALGDFSRLMDDAAGTVDDRLGSEYGDYARSAAQMIGNWSQSLDTKDVDVLIEDARAFVRKSPAVALGTAAALGFVVARVVRSGFETQASDDTRDA